MLSQALAYSATQNDENQLIRVYSTNEWKAEFTYDGLGRRRVTADFRWDGTTWVQTNDIHYYYDGMRVIQERNGSTPTVSYTRGTDLSGTLDGAGGIGGLLARSSGYSSGNWTNHDFYFA